MDLKDKVVLITGGSSGIGAATAIKFTEIGAKVAIVGRNQTKLKNVTERAASCNKPLVIVADISKNLEAKKAVSDTVAHFGKIDILVNNAGVGGNLNILSIESMEHFDTIINTNLRAAVYITHLAVPRLIESKGNIINISSIASTNTVISGNYGYCASKAALDHFSKCIALELAPKGVRVNIVNPGPVRTDFLENMNVSNEEWDHFSKASPLKRIGKSEEITDLVLFLASDKARSITGSSFVSDNGFLLRGFH